MAQSQSVMAGRVPSTIFVRLLRLLVGLQCTRCCAWLGDGLGASVDAVDVDSAARAGSDADCCGWGRTDAVATPSRGTTGSPCWEAMKPTMLATWAIALYGTTGCTHLVEGGAAPALQPAEGWALGTAIAAAATPSTGAGAEAEEAAVEAGAEA